MKRLVLSSAFLAFGLIGFAAAQSPSSPPSTPPAGSWGNCMSGSQPAAGSWNCMGQQGCMSGGPQGMMGWYMMGVPGTVTTVENTADGAVVRLTNADPSKVAQVQAMARMMGSCMAPAATPPQK